MLKCSALACLQFLNIKHISRGVPSVPTIFGYHGNGSHPHVHIEKYTHLFHFQELEISTSSYFFLVKFDMIFWFELFKDVEQLCVTDGCQITVLASCFCSSSLFYIFLYRVQHWALFELWAVLVRQPVGYFCFVVDGNWLYFNNAHFGFVCIRVLLNSKSLNLSAEHNRSSAPHRTVCFGRLSCRSGLRQH